MSANPRHHAEWPGGYDCVVHHELDSTMAEAARIGPTIKAPTWVLARHQTAAKGRRGKAWVHPAGNLAATLVYHPLCTPAVAAQRSFVAANALFETLALYTDRAHLALKWPNDVLLKGGKVAGILLETSGRGPFVDWLSVGIGVNLKAVPEGVTDAAFAPISLKKVVGDNVTPQDFLVQLAVNYATQEGKLDKFGFDRIRRDWLSNAARLGEVITAKTGQEKISGIFDSIDKDGNLVLITGRGPRAIPAADIYF